MEKSCATFLCDPGWCVHKSDVQNKWDDNTHTHSLTWFILFYMKGIRKVIMPRGYKKSRLPEKKTICRVPDNFKMFEGEKKINFLLLSTLLKSYCVLCVFFPFIMDIKFVGRTSRGHTGGRSHRISHPPSFCGACLNFSREKDSAIPFPRRP